MSWWLVDVIWVCVKVNKVTCFRSSFFFAVGVFFFRVQKKGREKICLREKKRVQTHTQTRINHLASVCLQIKLPFAYEQRARLLCAYFVCSLLTSCEQQKSFIVMTTVRTYTHTQSELRKVDSFTWYTTCANWRKTTAKTTTGQQQDKNKEESCACIEMSVTKQVVACATRALNIGWLKLNLYLKLIAVSCTERASKVWKKAAKKKKRRRRKKRKVEVELK